MLWSKRSFWSVISDGKTAKMKHCTVPAKVQYRCLKILIWLCTLLSPIKKLPSIVLPFCNCWTLFKERAFFFRQKVHFFKFRFYLSIASNRIPVNRLTLWLPGNCRLSSWRQNYRKNQKYYCKYSYLHRS